MALDRDIAVSVIARAAAYGLRSGWEMLSATGVRGLRCAVEAASFEELFLTESDPTAVRVLGANVARYADRGVRLRVQDARQPLQTRPPVDWVDLDPYGSPVPFLAAAFASLSEGGVMGVAATDMPVLAGPSRAVCERRYGGRPVRGRLGPEGGLRLLLAHLESFARSQGRSIHPLLAYVGDHHVRAYLRVGRLSELPRGSLVATIDPTRWDGPPLTGGPGPLGPLWVGPLFDAGFVRELRPPIEAAEPRQIHRFLERIREESEVDVPFYYEPNEIAGVEGLSRPIAPGEFVDRLRAQGYRASRTHARPEGFRTTAPRSVVFALARSEGDRD